MTDIPPELSSGAWADAFAPRRPGEIRYWLVKSEPDVFSFDDLLAAPKKTTSWDGVRNFAARNFLRYGMRPGDQVLFYHSSTNPQAIIGTCVVAKGGYPDPTALDPSHTGFDEKSKAGSPVWFAVDLKAQAKLPKQVTLADVKANPRLASMALIRVSRLSVTPVTPDEWAEIQAMAAR